MATQGFPQSHDIRGGGAWWGGQGGRGCIALAAHAKEREGQVRAQRHSRHVACRHALVSTACGRGLSRGGEQGAGDV